MTVVYYESDAGEYDQREALMEQRRQIDATLNRLVYKIERYEEAVQTGVLRWGTGVDCNG